MMADIVDFINANNDKALGLAIAKGINPNMCSGRNMPLLQIACYLGHEKCAKVLIAGGANVNIQTKHYGHTPLHEACHNGNISCVKMLIDAGADVNMQNIYGKAPMHYACERTRPDCVDALIAAGADVNIQDNDGKIPRDLTFNAEIIMLIDSYSGGHATKAAIS